MSRNWKRIQPTSLLHALRLCKDHAREKHNRSVERIADLMGVTHDALYKWLATGKMPASLIPAYEMACGIDYVSRWLAISAGKLVIDIPTGKTAKPGDIHELQDILNSAMGNLIRFYSGRAQADETLAAIQSAMEGLALHRGNVAKHAHPELDFGGEE
ncbi:hypothetical protein [Methylocaldum gracile]|jgi:hypothetical protein|uniref:hypothetical protein n=1 Tax=unclassified Methylocaldum TaxID=2622260 RepID=UPI001061BAFC